MALHNQCLPQVLFMNRNEKKGTLGTNLHLHSHPLLTLNQSAMFFNNGVATNSRKRKTNKVAETAVTAPPINLFSTQNQRPSQTLVSTALRLDLNGQPLSKQPQKMCMPFPSFTSLLMEDEDDDEDDLSEIIKEQNDQFDQIIKTHGDQLRRTLADRWRRHCTALLCVAEGRAVKRLREKELELDITVRRNAELEERAAHFRTEAQVWQSKVRTMEQTVASLRGSLHEATMGAGRGLRCAGCGEAQQEEDAESSYVDPGRIEPVRLACKACEKRVATVMMWPCRHVCVCMRCDADTKACPVCFAPKTTSVEVLP